MGNLANSIDPPIRLILVGDSGTGKTGALASLALAGYSIRMLDFDNGGRIIKKLLANDPEALSRVWIEPCTDGFKNLNGRLMPKTPLRAWPTAVKLLSRWRVGKFDKDGNPDPSDPSAYDLGTLDSWDRKCVLSLDSFTRMGEAAMRFHLSLNGRNGEHPQLQDWGVVQTMMVDLLTSLNDDDIKCHVVVNTHIDYRYKEIRQTDKNGKISIMKGEVEKGFPNAPGNKLPEKVGSYFNEALQVVVQGTGSGARRKITTVPLFDLGLKSSNPNFVKRDYDLKTGLAEYFADIQS